MGFSVTAIGAAANSIGAAQLQANAVTAVKILDGAVTLSKLPDGVLTANPAGRAKLADSFLPYVKAFPDLAVTCQRTWDPATQTLQSVLAGITDADASKPYEVVVPSGRFALPADFILKSFVSLKGAGGRSRLTTFTGGAFAFQQIAAQAAAGVSRIKLTGIRFETCGLVLDFSADATKTVVLELDDVSMNGASPFNILGFSNANRNVAWRAKGSDFAGNNILTYAQGDFKASELYFNTFRDGAFDFWNCIFPNAATLATDPASTNGIYRFWGCYMGRTADNEVAESLLSYFARATESVYWYGGPLLGASDPNTLAQLAGVQKGALYVTTAGVLYIKTAAIGTNTWAAV